MEDRAYFLGIDIGTNSSKGVIVDGGGKVVCRASAPHGMENPRPGYYEQDAEQVWWRDFCGLSKRLIADSGVSPREIRAAGASTLGADCLPVDESCRPLRKAILYGIDSRSTDELAELTEYYGEQRTREIFGRPMVTGDVAGKILWVKKREPEVYRRTYKFLTGSSYITAKLTGNYVIDRFLGIASFRPFYRPDGGIEEKMCEPVCRPDQLAAGRAATDIAGTVTAKAAKETGLSEGTPVITGTGDSAAEAVGCGVLSPGDIMVQFGSSLFFYCCTDRLISDDRVRGNTFLIPGTWSIAAGTNNAGTLQNWYRDQIFSGLAEAERNGGENAFSAMMDGIDALSPGSGGLITLPYFAGERTPVNDPDARGMLVGLTLRHTRRHLYRSALESLGYSVAQHMDIFRENGVQAARISAAGGGTKNHVWMQMIADIVGVEVDIAGETAGAAYGDALMAAVGVGYYAGFGDLKRVIGIGKRFFPDMERHAQYQPFYRLYADIYRQNRDILHRLTDLSGR